MGAGFLTGSTMIRVGLQIVTLVVGAERLTLWTLLAAGPCFAFFARLAGGATSATVRCAGLEVYASARTGCFSRTTRGSTLTAAALFAGLAGFLTGSTVLGVCGGVDASVTTEGCTSGAGGLAFTGLTLRSSAACCTTSPTVVVVGLWVDAFSVASCLAFFALGCALSFEAGLSRFACLVATATVLCVGLGVATGLTAERLTAGTCDLTETVLAGQSRVADDGSTWVSWTAAYR